MRHLGVGLLVLTCALAAVPPLSAQEPAEVGVAQCAKCHATLARRAWEAFHRKSGAQLDLPAARRYATATGGNPRAPRCVQCHAPSASDRTVGCESCHGPGSGYRRPHARPEFYQQPEGQRSGMRDLFGDGKVEAVARLCTTCHVLDPQKDAALAAAGHPTGRDFDPLGPRLEKMKHWPSQDDDDGGGPLSRPRAYGTAYLAALTRAASPQIKARVAALPVPAAAPPPAPGATAALGGAVKPSADPFFAEIVEDYVPGTLPQRPRPSRRIRSEAVEPASGGVVAPPLAPPLPPRAKPAPPSSGSIPPPADRAELQGRLVRIVEKLVKGRTGQLALDAPASPGTYPGPDGELLRIQDEVLGLALDALRKGPEPSAPAAGQGP